MKLLKTIFIAPGITCLLIFISAKGFGQFSISYIPNSETLTQGTAMTNLKPTVTNGPVSALSYGSGSSLGSVSNGLDNPYGAAVDASGNIYVANYGAFKDLGSISEYNVTTHTWSTFTTTSISNPSAITIDNSGNVYVLNYQVQDNGNHKGNGYVTEYNSTGGLVATIVEGLGPATGIAINNSNGNLDVAEESANMGNGVIAEYTTNGALNFTLTDTHIPNPVNVATDNAGNIYVLDNTNNDVVKYSSTGTYISTVVTSGLTNPFGLYVDGSGNIYVSDSGAGGTNSIEVYNASGTFLTNLSGLSDPEGMATDSKGNLFVTDFTNQTLTEYPATGGWFISGKLPPGLTFDYTTGTISGTPTTVFSSTTYTITAYNASGTASTATITLSSGANASAPTISYSPSVNVYTTGTAYTLAPTTTGSPTSFSISPAFAGNGTFKFNSDGSFSGTPSTVTAAAVYTITAKNAAGLTATTTVSLTFVKDNFWIGGHAGSPNDWNTKQNWSANTVPISTTFASIGVINYSSANEPIISSGGNYTVGYLTFGAAHAATLTVAAGGSLTINNILTVNDSANPTITKTGTGTDNVNVASTAVVNMMGGTLTINSGVTFTLKSTATSSASVGQIASGSIAGNVTVERYIPGGTGYRGYILLSSPVNYGTPDAYGNTIYSINYLVNSTYVTGSNFATTTFSKAGNPSLYLYRENLVPSNAGFTSGNYRGISDLSSPPSYTLNGDGAGYDIPVGNGYLFFFRGGAGTMNPYTTNSTPAAATLTATGALNQGSITFKHWYTPGASGLMYTTLSGDPTIEGFNLVGNPYACTIDLTTYATGGISMTNISKFVYELDPSSKNYGIYAVDGSVVPSNNASRYIVSGQGFFVLAINSSPTPQLTFNESCKVENIQNTGLNLLLGKPPVANNPQYLRLQMALDSVNTDESIIQFSSGAKNTYVFNEDAPYRVGTGKVSLSSISGDNKALAINQLPLSNGLTIPLKISASANGNYTLNLKDIKGVPALYDIWLKDTFTKDSVNMRATASYSFSITSDTTSTGSKRFTLMVKQNPALAYQLLSFNAEKTGTRQVKITWTTKNEQNYTNFTIQRSTDFGNSYQSIGGMVSSGQGQYELIDPSPKTGHDFYVLKSEDINGTISYSNFADVQFQDNAGDKAGSLSCYPNPTVNTINLTITPKKQGSTTYNIRISNSTGLVVKTAVTNETSWQSNVGNLLTGTYLVQVIDAKDNSIVGQTKFVKL